MTGVAAELSELSHTAAKYLDVVGWCQFTEQNDKGKVCITGAVMICQPENRDQFIVLEVLRHRGTAESWNDEAGRTVGEVRAALDRDITDADLAETFGPQWLEIVALIRRAAVLSHEEKISLAAGFRYKSPGRLPARRAIARVTGGADFALRSRHAAACACGSFGGAEAEDAAFALAVRHLIGRSSFTQEHYDLMTGQWRRVKGKLHPDDEDVKVEAAK